MTQPPRFLPARLHLDTVQPYRIPDYERAGMLRLDINESPAGAPEFVVEAVVDALRGQEIATYPVYAQWHREAAASFGVSEAHITCTSGGDEGIKAIFDTHLMPGRALVTVSPGYDMFALWAGLLGNEVVQVPLRLAAPAHFVFDPQAWQAALQPGPEGPQPGLVAIANPSNPTGTAVDRRWLEWTLEAVDCPVIVDETYGEFLGESVIDLIDRYRHLFVTRSFSKVYGLAGLRIGVVMSQPDNIEALRRVLNPFNVNRAAVAASLACMRHPEHTRAHLAGVATARDALARQMRALGVGVGAEHANFLLLHVGSAHAELTDALHREGILVRDRSGNHPQLDGCVRVAIGTPAQMKRLVGAVTKMLRPAPALAGVVLDVDGTLVDVAGSCRRAIEETCRTLLDDAGMADAAARVDGTLVDSYKARGSLNNDWDCALAIVGEAGLQVDREALIAVFQQRYRGTDFSGFIADEPWLLSPEDQAALLARWKTAIVTGRPREEALFTLRRHADPRLFELLVGMEDTALGKPDPEGLLRVARDLNAGPLAYVGDGVDDMRAAKAAGMLALGVLPPGRAWGSGWPEALYEAGADMVFGDIGQVVAWLTGSGRRAGAAREDA